MNEGNPPFTVVESIAFATRVVYVLGDFWAYEDIKRGIDIALSTDPFAFSAIGDTDMRAFPLNTPEPHAIYFTIDLTKGEVVLEDIY